MIAVAVRTMFRLLLLTSMMIVSASVVFGQQHQQPQQPELEPQLRWSSSRPLNRSLWPWHYHPRSDGNRTSTSNACALYGSCSSCNDESFCHWCSKDQACHVMGSIHGCLSGSSCNEPGPSPSPQDKNDTSCFSHKTCSECALSSHLCHWCAHDNACHAIGSVHGCTVGVDCFSNARCKRAKSEPVNKIVFTEMGWEPFCVMLALATMASGCVLVSWCVSTQVKGAYEDLALSLSLRHPSPFSAPTSRASPSNSNRHEDSMADPSHQTVSSEEQKGEQQQPQLAPAGSNDDEEARNHVDEYVRLVAGSDHDGDEEDPLQPSLEPSTSAPPPPIALIHMSRLYSSCVACHVANLVLIVLIVFASIRYYPKIPEYNICNDSVAWSSLIDSLTRMKATADFEILASVENLNYFDLVLERGSRGTFAHNGVSVGTFDIPPVTAQAMSVTDVLVVAHLSSDRWEALSLTEEYYRGALVLNVDVTVNIRIPALLNFFTTKTLQGIEVHVNELADRRLCVCEDWNSARNKSDISTSVLVVEELLPPLAESVALLLPGPLDQAVAAE